MPVALLLCALAVVPAEVENPFLELDPLVGVTAAVVAPHPAAFEAPSGAAMLFPGEVVRVDDVEGDFARVVADGEAGWVARGHIAPVDEAHAALTAAIDSDPRAGDLVARGRLRDGLGRKREAAEDFDRAVRVDPACVEARYFRGQARHAAGDPAGAEADYSEVLRLRPGAVLAVYARSNRGRARFNRGDLAGAIADFTEMTRVAPNAAVAYTDRARAWVAAGEVDRAVADLTEAIKRQPRGAELFQLRGIAREGQGRFAEAVADYEQAVVLDGGAWSAGGATAVKARLRAAWLLAAGPDASARDGERAVWLAARAVAHEPKGVRPLATLATLAAAHAEAGDFAEAARRQKEAVENADKWGPDKEEQESRLKAYEQKQPHRDRAIGYRPTRRAVVRLPLEAPIPDAGFRPGARVVVVAAEIAVPDGKGGTKPVGRGHSFKVIRADGETVVLKAKHGEVTARRAEVVPVSAAIARLTELIAAEPSAANREARARAFSHPEVGDMAAAVADADEAIRLEPTADRYALRASFHLLRGDQAAGLADASEAVRLDPANAYAYQLRGGLRLIVGDREGAMADMNEAIRLDPSCGPAYSARAALRAGEGRMDEALADLTEEIRLGVEVAQALNNRGTLRHILALADRDPVDGAEVASQEDRVGQLLLDAEADFAEAARLARSTEDVAKAWTGLAHLADATGRYAEALSHSEAAVQGAPRSHKARCSLAFQLAASPDVSVRDGRRAIEEAAEACRLSGWRDVESLRSLAAAYAECGDAEAAAAWQRRVVSRAGDDDERAKAERWAERYAAGERYRMKPTLPRPPVEARKG